jgi:mutator protein MutT
VIDNEARLLLVQRGRGAAVGQWSVPGGRVEGGETLEQAVTREVAEETGLKVRCGRFVGWVERISPDYHFVIMDFVAEVAGEQQALVAGDDAADAAWIPLDELESVDLVDGLTQFLDDHNLR